MLTTISQVTIVFFFIWFVIERLTDLWHRLYENSGTFFSRFLALALAREPRAFAPLIVDYWLLIQSTWTGRQLGPDTVYPMLSIKKRQSGRLARLILEHCRAVRQYERRTATPFPQGIDPPCVTVVHLDEVLPHIVENGYSTQVDLYGFMCLLILFKTLITLILHVFYQFDWGWMTWVNWGYCIFVNLIFCLYAAFHGEGTLTLARRSDASTPGCAVLLDQDFTVVLNGSQSVVEAIAESSFNLSHPSSVWTPGLLSGEYHGGDSSYDSLGDLCEAVYLIIFTSCWLLFRPSTTLGGAALMDHFSQFQAGSFSFKGPLLRGIPPMTFLMIYMQARMKSSYFSFIWQRDIHVLSALLIFFFSVAYRDRNYPIRSGKFLDALGHPRVRKWQFDTLAAAVTFQCLVICRKIPRPIRNIDVLALLDMLVPDQRDVWKAWKERVADRIMHEADILFAPTIPTFGDERQQQLKDLLDQAQLGDCAYRDFCIRSLE